MNKKSELKARIRINRKIRKGDLVKVMAGGNKGKIGKIIKIVGNEVWIEGVNTKVRHIAPNRLNPRGGKKDVHLPIDISNIALIHDGKEATSKVGYKITDAGKQRIAKKTGKEIK
jgi:large subunit ribosomal protein L24